MNLSFEEDKALMDLIKAMGSNNREVAFAAQAKFAKISAAILREVILPGNITGGIFTPEFLAMDASPEWHTDLIAPGDMVNHVAYTASNIGRIADRHVEADKIMIPTFDIANSIDFSRRLAKTARYPVVARAMQILRAGFLQKMNDAGWHTILSAVADRNVLVYDADANAGMFTKRLISLMKVLMRRNAGGNSTSTNRGKLSNIYISPEGVEDVRNWGVEQLDEVTRREIHVGAEEDRDIRLFGVGLVALDEFGQGQTYQKFFTEKLGASIQGSDEELVVGLDLTDSMTFQMPVKENIEITEDPSYHRANQISFYGRGNMGWAVLDNRKVIGGSY